MNIESILKYQDLDKKLFAVEQKKEKSVYKKKRDEIEAFANREKAKVPEYENAAAGLAKEIDEINKKFASDKAKLDKILEKNVENLTMEEIEKLETVKNAIVAELGALEKRLQKTAESVKTVVDDYKKTRKSYDEARLQYAQCKKKMEEENKQFEPEIEKLKKELQALEKDVDADLLAKYKKRRNDKVAPPIFVPLVQGEICGGCFRPQPKAAIAKIKAEGIATCEEEGCKRYIYNK